MRYIYGDDPKEEELVAKGVPPILVKALLAEARLWKMVWNFFTKR